MKRIVILLGALALQACATAPENYARTLNFTWNIKPESTQKQVLDVDAGTIFFEWDASAKATHEMVQGAGKELLIASPTTRGTLYCTRPGETAKCYEDRDADSQFDHVWQVHRDDNSPIVLQQARKPEEMKQPKSFQAVASNDIMINQKLGLIYDGPNSGDISENGELTDFVARFLLGWHNGKTGPRDPRGGGWSTVDTIYTKAGDPERETGKHEGPEFWVKALSAKFDGTARVEVKAEPVTEEMPVKKGISEELLRSLLGSLAR